MSRTPVISFRKCVISAALLCVARTASAQTRNRLAQRIEDSEPSVVARAHPMARAEFDHGRVDGSMRIDRAAMVFKLASAQQSALEKLLAEQQNPKSSNYHKWLTPEQYAARFGMSDDDLARVASWLKSQGLTINGFSRGRTRVFFSGTAAQVEGVFRTEFHYYLVNGEMHFANATELSVPAALSGVFQGLRGLDDFRPQPRAHAVKNFTSHQSGNHYLAPADFAKIYNLKPLYDAGFDGTGEKIAVVGQTEIHTADIDAFRSAAGLPATNLQLVLITGGGSGFSSSDEVEADLDVEWSGGVAKNAAILYVYAGANATSKNVFDAFAYAIDNNLAPVVSISYGNCEASLGTFVQTLRQDVQQANSQGQTVTAASGDAGAADCELQSAKSATHGLAVDGPASVPEVTGIGGSEFNGDAAGTVSGTAPNTNASDTAYWSGTGTTNADNVSSAIKYIPEMAWNDTAASIATTTGGLSASGGGVSTVFAKPTWQTALTPADSHRDVPDVSLTASPNHDGSLICSQAFFGTTPTSCSSGFRASDGIKLAVVGVTSVSAPAFAGIVAILNQATQASTGSGNINTTLYSLAASTPSAFHEIATGDNIVPCTAGSTGCPASHTIGFSADTGYDLVTGLGSIDANVLVTSWPGFVAIPNFSLGGSSASISAPGQSGTSTITVSATNGFTGTVDLSCTPPTGSSQITCSFGATTPVTLDSTTTSATATLTVSTVAPHVLAGTSASLQSQHGLVRLAASASALLAGVFVLGMPSRRRRRLAGLGLMLLVFFAAGLGCGGGGGGGSGSGSSVKTGGTPKGNYTILVTATSGSLSKPLNVSLAVQ